jgi:hypothetical protein
VRAKVAAHVAARLQDNADTGFTIMKKVATLLVSRVRAECDKSAGRTQPIA